jgi:hypothetical protein
VTAVHGKCFYGARIDDVNKRHDEQRRDLRVGDTRGDRIVAYTLPWLAGD